MIYIVEDDRNIQEIELFALKNSGYQAVGFETAKEFYKALSTRLPELILLDIMLPDEDGMSILKRLRSRADTQKIPVILVTAKATEIDKVKGLDGGADDYIAKPFGVMEMIARVKALLRRSSGLEESILTCGDVTLDSEKRMVYAAGRPVELTYKEFELLRLLMSRPGAVCPKGEILETLWGGAEDNNLEAYISFLRKKLFYLGSRASIATLRKVGYRLEDPGEDAPA